MKVELKCDRLVTILNWTSKKWAQSVLSATEFKLLDFYQGRSIVFSMVFWLGIHIEFNWKCVRYLTKELLHKIWKSKNFKIQLVSLTDNMQNRHYVGRWNMKLYWTEDYLHDIWKVIYQYPIMLHHYYFTKI